MSRKLLAFAGILMLVLAVTACGNDGDDDSGTTSTGSTTVTLNEDYPDALPVSSQLAIGTFLLEETDNAVTVEQAGKLLPNWKMLQALQSSGTAAQVELDTVLKQIQGAMTDGQLTAIKEMQLTQNNIMELLQERGVARGFADGASREGGFRPPEGVIVGGGGRPGGGEGGPPGGAFGGGFGNGFGGGTNTNPEEQAATLQERMNRLAGTAMTGMLVSLLEARAKGESWEIAAPNQDFWLQRVLLAALTETTGLDQQAIMEQAGEGKTLREIAVANGADVDEILAQAVTTETERVNQAVADGSMEQTDADQWLADLETRIEALLDQPLQFGGRGPFRDNAGQP